jgi:hypothetical protein
VTSNKDTVYAMIFGHMVGYFTGEAAVPLFILVLGVAAVFDEWVKGRV